MLLKNGSNGPEVEKIVAKITQPSADLSFFFPEIPPETLRNDAKLIKGELGVANGMSDLDEFFKDAAGYTAVILSASGKALISIRFEESEGLQKFTESHNWRPDNLSEAGNTMSIDEQPNCVDDVFVIYYYYHSIHYL